MTQRAVRQRTTCRICSGEDLYQFLNLGNVPMANGFLDSPTSDELAFPLVVVVCDDCNHVQLLNTVDRELLFNEYHYFSSASDPLLTHFSDYAQAIENRYLDPGDFVVEIGSNDGVLLQHFSENIDTIGVEPASNVAKAAEERGIRTINQFFTVEVARSIRDNHGPADAMFANNVVGHIDDLMSFMEGISLLLDDEGVFTMEVPYLVDLLSNHQFDTIYHEHISYFAIRPLARLCQQVGMKVVDVERLDIHGGSVRVHIVHGTNDTDRSPIVDGLTELELALNLNEREPYDWFANRVQTSRSQLRGLINRLTEQNQRIVGYGAPAKGNILLNYCDIGDHQLDYLLDTTPAKQGTYSPGMHIPVVNPDRFANEYPDYALLLAWNYQSEILEKEREFRQTGGRFIIPIPYVDIV